MNYQREDYIQYSKEKKKKETRSIAWYLTTHITLYIVLIFFLIFFAWYTYFLVSHRYYIVKGKSMQPFLNDSIILDDGSEDAVFANIYEKAEFGDIVVINTDEGEDIIKRVIGESGDFISIREYGNSFHVYRIPNDSIVYENGKIVGSLIGNNEALLEENERNGFSYNIDYSKWSLDYFHEEDNVLYEKGFYDKFLSVGNYTLFSQGEGENKVVYVQVPENSYFCLGDNREHPNSKDSRFYGFFKDDSVVGTVDIFVYDYSFVNRVLKVIEFYYKEVEDFFAR